MRSPIHKQQRIARLHIHLNGPGHAIHRPVFPHPRAVELRVLEIRLVAARNQHRAPVARPDIRQRQQNIHLPAHKPPAAIAELIAVNGRVSPRMQSNGLARPPETRKIFVDKQRSVVVVERAFPTHEKLHLVKPGWVIDQLLKRLAGLVNLLVIDARCNIAVRMALDMAVPIAGIERRNLVQTRIEILHLLRRQSAFEMQIPPQIEQIDIQIGNHI